MIYICMTFDFNYHRLTVRPHEEKPSGDIRHIVVMNKDDAYAYIYASQVGHFVVSQTCLSGGGGGILC